MESKLLKMVIIVAAVVLVTWLLTFILRRIKTKSRRVNTVLYIIASLVKYLAAIVILCSCLDVAGFDVKAIIAGVGLLALIVGFGAESLISDSITGMFMVFENQYNVGDIIEVQDFRGTVVNMGIRTTSIMDTGGNIKIINNSDMKNVLNRSANVSKAVCDIAVTAATSEEFDSFEKKIPEICSRIYEKNTDIFKQVPEYLGIQSIDGDSLTLRFTVDVEEKNIYDAQRALNHDVFVAVKALTS